MLKSLHIKLFTRPGADNQVVEEVRTEVVFVEGALIKPKAGVFLNSLVKEAQRMSMQIKVRGQRVKFVENTVMLLTSVTRDLMRTIRHKFFLKSWLQ